MRTLHGLGYSPWTEKARWALDHHDIPYRYEEHLPIVGIPLLRLRAGKLSGKVTVPFLSGEGDAVCDSIEIARVADRLGKKAPLFPEGRSGPIVDRDQQANEILDVARGLVILRTRADADVQREAVPAFVPRALQGVSLPLTRMTASLIARKYGSPADAEARLDTVVIPRLQAWQEALGDSDHFLGDFSYADITVAATLQCVDPVRDEYIPLGPATRRAWANPSLKGRFGALLAWRDRLYASSRR